MRSKGIPRIIVTTLAASGLVVAAGASGAEGAPTSPKPGPHKAAAVTKRLGSTKTAGIYLDRTKSPVVNVTTGQAAQKVKDAGLKPRIVKYSMKQLSTVKQSIDRSGLVPGSSWSVNPKTNRVVVTTDKTVTGAKLDKVKSATSKFAGKVAMRRTDGVYRAKVSGGDAIWGSGSRCSLGFNVVHKNDPTKHAFLTAGHCGNAVQSWSEDQAGQTSLGNTTDSQFPGDDYAIVDYTSSYSNYPSTAGGQQIDKAGAPTAGETVTRDGSTTGTHSGKVTALDASVQYQEGTVNGLIQTTVCAEPGDSGGSLYSGSTAYGLTSGGSGDCTSGGETFFQPVQEALQAYNVEIG